MTKARPKIALLGWGSLLWDKRPEFDEHHEEWQPEGPMLPLEFSRYSTSRNGALTLVIDPANGAQCRSAFAMSTRRDPDDAIADLRCREGSVMRRMGYHFRDGSRQCQPPVPDTIPPWAALHDIDVVVWTGLPSNFEEKVKKPFSVENAKDHLQSLPDEAKVGALKYIRQSRDLVVTPLRTALAQEAWFAAGAAGTEI